MRLLMPPGTKFGAGAISVRKRLVGTAWLNPLEPRDIPTRTEKEARLGVMLASTGPVFPFVTTYLEPKLRTLNFRSCETPRMLGGSEKIFPA